MHILPLLLKYVKRKESNFNLKATGLFIWNRRLKSLNKWQEVCAFSKRKDVKINFKKVLDMLKIIFFRMYMNKTLCNKFFFEIYFKMVFFLSNLAIRFYTNMLLQTEVRFFLLLLGLFAFLQLIAKICKLNFMSLLFQSFVKTIELRASLITSFLSKILSKLNG